MNKITEYKVEVPMYGLVDYVSIQYTDDFAVSMTKAQWVELQAQQEHLTENPTEDE